MNLIVLKGFSKEKINEFNVKPLCDNNNQKYDILNYNLEYSKELLSLITAMKEDKYITYEEYALLCYKDNGNMLNTMLGMFNIKLKIVYNNIYPELYPCTLINTDMLNSYYDIISDDNIKEIPENLDMISQIYSKIIYLNKEYYITYKNFEYDIENIEFENKYNDSPLKLDRSKETEFIYEIDGNEELYIEKILELENGNYKNIGIKLVNDDNRVKDIYKNFCAYLNYKGTYILSDYDKYAYRKDLTEEFEKIAKNDIKIPDFKGFKELDFYENPGINTNMIKVSQSQIMSDMVEQALNARKCEELAIETKGEKLSGYRDIFVTAPTGAGKSVMFQIPAVYLAKEKGLLTIIITPLIELMNDQVRNLHERGYRYAERLNSSINPLEKKKIVNDISEGKINLLYLAPETLLSYSIDQLIGDRKIGLVIIDEAHIVSTWGKGFRPDYWYLGSYLDKLRKVRNSKGLKDINKIIYSFPICTFTATAVNGGKYDDVSDIKTSLNLRDTITYYGKVIRKEIKFDIHNYSEEKTKNKDEHELLKNAKFKERIEEYIKNNNKVIVYFPYASTARHAYEANPINGFGNLKEYKDKFTIYTGGNSFNNNEKSENMLEFRDNKKRIMFATKAFGMGIDIKDIDSVYHYAASGNLNDYVQEIGRVARSKDVPTGVARLDYYDRDLNYMKTLYGMSALHNFQVQKILSIIINIYDSKKKYNLLFTPDMFKPVFAKGREDDLENKIKSALLTIEKDLDNRYRGSKPIVTRARNMFTECYAMVDRDQEKNLMKSKFGKYFKKISYGRKKEIDLKSKDTCLVTDSGDIFIIDLKSLWEEQYNKLTFAEFKYNLNNNIGIFDQYGAVIRLRNKVTIKMIDESNLSTLKEKILNEIDIVSNILNEIQIEGKYYSNDEFAVKLEEKYKNKFKAKVVANSYLDMLSSYKDAMTPSFYETREINGEIKFMITRGSFRSIAEKIINTSAFLRRMRSIEKTEYVTYEGIARKRLNDRDNKYDAINIALLFGLVTFEILGGNKPEIFIRINYPEKIRQIVKGNIPYTNSLVDQAKMRHKNDVTILNYFFSKLKTDDERWNFIEKYYLGKITTEDGNVLIENI